MREQNLDADGYIKVHEQGTASVRVTNDNVPVAAENFPATQQVAGMVVFCDNPGTFLDQCWPRSSSPA